MTKAADLLRRANREGCTLLLGTCRVDRVGPVMAAVVAKTGIEQEAIVVVGIVAAVVVVVVIAYLYLVSNSLNVVYMTLYSDYVSLLLNLVTIYEMETPSKYATLLSSSITKLQG